MRYGLIGVDGALGFEAGDWRSGVGDHGASWVRLGQGVLLAGWVPAAGRGPDVLPANLVGSAVLVSLGAEVRPYAGPVVVTGLRGGEPCQLCTSDVDRLEQLHLDVRRVLEGGSPEPGLEGWAAEVRRLAAGIEAEAGWG